MKHLPFSICALLAIWLNSQANQHHFPLGIPGSYILFLLSAAYSIFYLLKAGFRFFKELQWGRFSLWALIPIGLVSVLFILLESDRKFKYENLFEDSTYRIIGQFLPVSGGNHMYWVLKKTGIGWRCITDTQYGRIETFYPQIISTRDGAALLRYPKWAEQVDTLLLK